MELTGVWAEELDSLFPSDHNGVAFRQNSDGLAGVFAVREMAEIIHPKEGCEVLAVYTDDFYKDTPAVTKNRVGKGSCYYFAARTENACLDAFYGCIVQELGIEMAFGGEFPLGVTVQQRYGDGETYYFVLNFNAEPKQVVLPGGRYYDFVGESEAEGSIELPAYGTAVLKKR